MIIITVWPDTEWNSALESCKEATFITTVSWCIKKGWTQWVTFPYWGQCLVTFSALLVGWVTYGLYNTYCHLSPNILLWNKCGKRTHRQLDNAHSPEKTANKTTVTVVVFQNNQKMFHQTQTARRPPKGWKMPFFVPGDLDLQTPQSEGPKTSSVWIQRKFVQRFQRYFVHKQKTTDWLSQKQNLPQFTACGNRWGNWQMVITRWLWRWCPCAIVTTETLIIYTDENGISSYTILRHFVIQLLNGDVVTQQVKALTVRLPEELEPWSQDGTVGTILHVFPTHGTHQQADTHTTHIQDGGAIRRARTCMFNPWLGRFVSLGPFHCA